MRRAQPLGRLQGREAKETLELSFGPQWLEGHAIESHHLELDIELRY